MNLRCSQQRFIYVYLCTYIYIYIYIYTHTHTRTHTTSWKKYKFCRIVNNPFQFYWQTVSSPVFFSFVPDIEVSAVVPRCLVGQEPEFQKVSPNAKVLILLRQLMQINIEYIRQTAKAICNMQRSFSILASWRNELRHVCSPLWESSLWQQRTYLKIASHLVVV